MDGKLVQALDFYLTEAVQKIKQMGKPGLVVKQKAMNCLAHRDFDLRKWLGHLKTISYSTVPSFSCGGELGEVERQRRVEAGW